MTRLPLSRGFFAIVDDEDVQDLIRFSWCVSGDSRYAVSQIQGKVISMHRYLMDAKPGQEVDHRNGNGLDNRQANLRFCSRSEQMRNTKRRRTNRSGFKGVSFCQQTSQWKARLQIDGKAIWLGRYETAEQASDAYAAAAKKHFGEFVRLE